MLPKIGLSPIGIVNLLGGIVNLLGVNTISMESTKKEHLNFL
jgi:hypothetical protein